MGRVVAKEPCEKCGSKDNLARYEDGSGYCFTPGCGFKRGQDEVVKEIYTREVEDPRGYRGGSAPNRSVGGTVADLFGCKVSTASDGSIHSVYYPYYRSDGASISWKVRQLPKQFKVIGGLDDIKLFGQEAFTQGGKRLVITEGEEDALAVAQAYNNYNGRIYPAVSIPSSSNLKPVVDNRDWIRSFDEVVLYVDKDAAGDMARGTAGEDHRV